MIRTGSIPYPLLEGREFPQQVADSLFQFSSDFAQTLLHAR
jgi:hypothetical protein